MVTQIHPKPLHVLVVANHWSIKNNDTFGGVWADRQIVALQNLGVQVSRFDLGTSHSPLKILAKLWELRRRVKDEIDLVHARYGTIVGAVSALSGAPTVVTYAGSDLLWGDGTTTPVRYALGVVLSQFAAVRAAGLICVSEELRQALWWRRGDVSVIPDGVDLLRFLPMERTAARNKLGWDQQKRVIAIDAARDPVGKGLPLAEAAVKQLREHFPDVELKVLIGVKPDEMPLFLNAADLLLCCSRREGSPNIVKEAIACNLPVVTVPVGDVAELLRGVKPSRIVPRDPEVLAEAMIPLLRERPRSNGGQHVAHLGLDQIARRVLSVYHRALGRSTTSETPGISRNSFKAEVDPR